jgi:hypothetical protein
MYGNVHCGLLLRFCVVSVHNFLHWSWLVSITNLQFSPGSGRALIPRDHWTSYLDVRRFLVVCTTVCSPRCLRFYQTEWALNYNSPSNSDQSTRNSRLVRAAFSAQNNSKDRLATRWSGNWCARDSNNTSARISGKRWDCLHIHGFFIHRIKGKFHDRLSTQTSIAHLVGMLHGKIEDDNILRLLDHLIATRIVHSILFPLLALIWAH